MLADLRYAYRTLVKTPALTAAALASLTLGIGANLAIFNVANALLLRNLPVERPDELALLQYVTRKGNVFDAFSFKEYQALRENQTLSGLAATALRQVNFAAGERSERVLAQLVSGEFFAVLGVRPQLGRLLGPDDNLAANAHPVTVISHGLWQSRFGSDPAVAGQTVRLNGHRYTIAGVAPPEFEGTSQSNRVDLWVPVMMAAQIITRPVNEAAQPPFLEWEGWLELIGRRKSGVNQAAVEAELDSKFAILRKDLGEYTFEISNQQAAPGTRDRILVKPGGQGDADLKVRYQLPIRILMGVVALLLLIASANTANLLLARAAARRKEMAIRLALGAGRVRLVRQLMSESLLLAAMAAALGVLISYWASDALVQMLPQRATMALDVRPDWITALFAVALSAGCAILFGLAPALQSARTDVAPMIKGDAAGGRSPRFSLGNALVVVQVALSVLMLAGAGLFLRSLANIRSIDPGFRTENLLLASVNPGSNGYKDAALRTLYERLLEQAGRLPGVRSASIAQVSPMSGTLWLYTIQVPGYQPAPKETPMAWTNAIGPGYFSTIGARLVAGREFTFRDRAGAPPVVVVNEAMARKFWPGRDALGQRFIFREKQVEVAGVVKDTAYRELREERPATVYTPLLQGDHDSGTLHLHVSGDPGPVVAGLREALRGLDANLPLYRVQTLERQIDNTISRERLLATLSAIFGGLAILLAAVGLYGVLGYAVTRRTREIGIRMALGAQRADVLSRVLRESLAMAALGVALGLPAAWAASQWVASLLYGVKPGDPLTYGGIVFLLLGVALLAGLVPARRASRVDPMVALRHD
ncbi:MAG: ABC transporter permease [Bryobacteraceae bacterium]|nr:ABC transporter permease [Bryobacteraceae bacterium]